MKQITLILLCSCFLACSRKTNFRQHEVPSLNVFSLPKVTGKYQVGTKIFEAVDSSRVDIVNNSLKRRLVGQLWYPSEQVDGERGPSGILTNVYDLHKFLDGLDNEKLIKKEYLQKMYNEQMEGEAFGFHVLNKSDIGKILARGGGLPHFESQIVWYKEKDIQVILLINNHLRKRQLVWDGIENIIFKTE